jgi:excisionase family DNA binding protein
MIERQMTSGEAAKRLGISTGWIRRLELEGEIPPARRLSRFRIYTEEEVEQLRKFLEERRESRRRPTAA